MPKIIFSYEIECDANEKIEDIYKNFSEIINKKKEALNLIYNGIIINKDLTFKELIDGEDEKKNSMKIVVVEKAISNGFNDNIIAAKHDNNNINYSNVPKLDYNQIKEYNFRHPNLKYKSTITYNNNELGLNDTFEVFTSYKDNNQYLVSKNVCNLEIFRLLDCSIILTAKGHSSKIISVRYFINENNNNEYLISVDENNIIIIWDITNNYTIERTIECLVHGGIYSCLLIFPRKEAIAFFKTYIVASSIDESKEKESLIKGKILLKYASNSYYLLSWYNENDSNYYIIKLGIYVNIRNLVNDSEYYSFKEKESIGIHNSGFLYRKKNIDYLCTSSIKGFICIYNLKHLIITKIINTNQCRLMHIIQWNQEYAIVADYENKSFKVANLDNGKIVSHIKGVHCRGIICVKKIYHPIFGESLLTSGSDKTIKLWTI